MGLVRCRQGSGRRFAGAAISAISVVAVACSANSTELPQTAPNGFSGPPGVPKSLSQIAGEQASAMVHRYYEQYSKALTDPQVPEQSLNAILAPSFYRDLRVFPDVRSSRTPGVKVTGVVRASMIRVQQAGLVTPMDRNGVPKPGEAKLRLKVCEDRTALQTIKDGVVVKDDKVLQAQLRNFDVVNPGWPGNPIGWVIVGAVYTVNTPCETT